MEFTILDIAPLLSSIQMTITFMRGHNLLLQDYFCCGMQCSKVRDIKLSDQEIFQCKSTICRKRYSIRTNSFWFKSKLPLNVLIGILYFFATGSSFTEVYKHFKGKISKPSIIQWFNYFRDLMTTYFVNNRVIFNNCTVHVDETFIGSKRKYGKGRIPKCKQRYLFGIIDQISHKAYMQFVPKKDHRNIIPIIERHVNAGCTINSDGANVYKILGKLNYTHNVVIHDRHYVDPITGTHTNWIENYWSNLKMKLKSIRGSQKTMTDGHLDEYLYRYNRKHEGSVFNLLLEDIANFYPI